MGQNVWTSGFAGNTTIERSAGSRTLTSIYSYMYTQIHKYTNTEVHKYTNTKMYKYLYIVGNTTSTVAEYLQNFAPVFLLEIDF